MEFSEIRAFSFTPNASLTGAGNHVLGKELAGAPTSARKAALNGTGPTRRSDTMMVMRNTAILVALMGVLVALFSGVALAKVINGNGADNRLVGTPKADTIRGFGGEDVIKGRAGADTLIGGSGDDDVYGSYGNDVVRVVDGDDDDEVYCGGGFDRVRADDDDDVSGSCERVVWVDDDDGGSGDDDGGDDDGGDDDGGDD